MARRPQAVAALLPCSVLGTGEGRKGGTGWQHDHGGEVRGWAQGKPSGAVRQRRRRGPAMDAARRRRQINIRDTTNEYEFVKQMACRCRGRRDKPQSGDGFRRGCRRWSENLAEASPEKFAGNEIRNFGDRSTGLRAAARKKGCTSGISASRATPAYI